MVALQAIVRAQRDLDQPLGCVDSGHSSVELRRDLRYQRLRSETEGSRDPIKLSILILKLTIQFLQPFAERLGLIELVVQPDRLPVGFVALLLSQATRAAALASASHGRTQGHP